MITRRYGFTDLGRIRIPPLPVNIILTDRDDGTLWWLIHVTDPAGPDGYGYVAIESTIPTLTDKRIYAANEGPILPTEPRARLIIRGGYLGYEFETTLDTGITDRDQAPIHTRNGLKSETRRIIIPTDWSEHGPVDTLAWEPIDF